jgi:hypothetical protein
VRYEKPLIDDYGTLVELTAHLHIGGPEDAVQKGVGPSNAPPGHSCPPGPPVALGGSGCSTDGQTTTDPGQSPRH